VTDTTAAPSEIAVKHFQEMLAFETDCWDVHESLKLDIRLRERARRQQSDVCRASEGEKNVAKAQAQWPRLALYRGAFSSCGSLAMFATGLLLHSANPNVADIRPTPA
jgi:hypothetical protein